jgi:hypothetical protein
MEMVEHMLTLRGPDVARGRPRPGAVGRVLQLVEPVVRDSISMGFRNTSKVSGRRPDWLRRASDIRFVGLSAGPDGTTVLHFTAPRFGEAAEELYKQGQLFDVRPRESDTGFDLLGDVLGDIRSKAEDSLRFDARLLEDVGRFRSFPDKQGVESIAIAGDRLPAGRPPALDEEVSNLAEEMRQKTPPASRARVAGKLDMIRDHDNVFELILSSGAKVRGVWTTGQMDILAQLFREDVVVEGQAVFRVSGNLLRIEADAVRKATTGDEFFRRIPLPVGKRAEPRSFLRPQAKGSGADAVHGRWPGKESEQEILAALRELD